LKAIITRRMRVEEERHTALESRLLAARASGFLGAHALAVVTSAAGHCDVWWLVGVWWLVVKMGLRKRRMRVASCEEVIELSWLL
jgi:hypothetical protein